MSVLVLHELALQYKNVRPLLHSRFTWPAQLDNGGGCEPNMLRHGVQLSGGNHWVSARGGACCIGAAIGAAACYTYIYYHSSSSSNNNNNGSNDSSNGSGRLRVDEVGDGVLGRQREACHYRGFLRNVRRQDLHSLSVGPVGGIFPL